MTLRVNGNKYSVEVQDQFDQLLRKLGLHNIGAQVVNDIKAPMPGLVLRLETVVGDHVSKGDALLVLEAMKMEHTLRAPFPARVAQLNCAVGDQVTEGTTLVMLEPLDEKDAP